MAFYSTESRQFLDEEIALAISLGDQVALAIENTRLYRRAEEAAVMEERERLARDLHDSVTQSLYSLTLFAEAGRRSFQLGQIERVQSYLSQLNETAQQALKEMRLLLYELRPIVLEQEGLSGALRRRVDAVEKRAGISVAIVMPESLVLPAYVEEGLYRIAQESLNNSLKHAFATHVSVRLQRKGDDVTLEITDNGIGFDLANINASKVGGMGLNNMRERAEKLHADLSVQSSPGGGTKILLQLNIAPHLQTAG
jgi:signal transduction histidine kinase